MGRRWSKPTERWADWCDCFHSLIRVMYRFRSSRSSVQNVNQHSKWRGIPERPHGRCCTEESTKKVWKAHLKLKRRLAARPNSSVRLLVHLWPISWPEGMRSQKFEKLSENKRSERLKKRHEQQKQRKLKLNQRLFRWSSKRLLKRKPRSRQNRLEESEENVERICKLFVCLWLFPETDVKWIKPSFSRLAFYTHFRPWHSLHER